MAVSQSLPGRFQGRQKQNSLFLSPSLLPLKVFCGILQLACHLDIVDLRNRIHDKILFPDREHEARHLCRVHDTIETAKLCILEIRCLHAGHDHLIYISRIVKNTFYSVSFYDPIVFLRCDRFYNKRDLLPFFILKVFQIKLFRLSGRNRS